MRFQKHTHLSAECLDLQMYKVGQGSVKIKRLSNENINKLENRSSLTDTDSNESFYSCHSNSSLQDQTWESPKRNNNTSNSSENKSRSAVDELFKQVTMVNAIFLNNTVGECSHNKHSKEERQDSEKQNNNTKQYLNPFKMPCSNSSHTASGTEYAQKSCVNNDSVKSFPNSNSSQFPPNNWDSKVSFNTGDLSKPFQSYFYQTRDTIYDSSCKNNDANPSALLTIPKRKYPTSKPIKNSISKIIVVRNIQIPSTKDNKITPISVEKEYKITKEKRKHSINEPIKLLFLEPTHLKLLYHMAYPKTNCSRQIIKTDDPNIRNAQKNSESIMNNLNINEPYIKSIIQQSFEKLINESIEVNNAVCSYNSKTEYAIKEGGGDLGKINSTSVHNLNYLTSLSGHKGSEHQIIAKNCPSSNSTSTNSQLDVIEEEDAESYSLEEENLEDDYCLTDSRGKPIHLFDSRGLPLTDNRGRPLRTAQGNVLMNCDRSGIPIVGDFPIFDMFGRQPHEDQFDPAMAPKMPNCNKLCTSDGRPLLLYDAEGRPLTSVSGTMLVDSSGRGLFRLTFNQEDV